MRIRRVVLCAAIGVLSILGVANSASADPGEPCDGHGGIASASAGFNENGSFVVEGSCGDGTQSTSLVDDLRRLGR